MVFKRFVQTGRIIYITEGPSKGKIAAIVDVIDQNRVLVDGPESGVPRRPVHLKNVHLTRYRIKFPFTAPTRIVRKSWKAGEVNEKWAKSKWGQRLTNTKIRQSMTDFDRFKLRDAKKERNRIRTGIFKRLKKQAHASGALKDIGVMMRKKHRGDAKAGAGAKAPPQAKPGKAPAGKAPAAEKGAKKAPAEAKAKGKK